MRAVIDTNVLVRATKNATGPAREALRYFESEAHVFVLSQFILTELVRVLNYPRVQALHRLSMEECAEFVASLYQFTEIVPIAERDLGEAISSDPDDDPIIATAGVGKADIICTLDRHFRQQNVQSYCSQQAIRIVSDLELLKLLREQSDEEGK